MASACALVADERGELARRRLAPVADGEVDVAVEVACRDAGMRGPACQEQRIVHRREVSAAEELLARIAGGRSTLHIELPLLKDLGQAMRDASICGLGQTASSAIESAVEAGLLGRAQ